MKCIAVQTTNPPEKLRSADLILPNLSLLAQRYLEKLFP
jgi:hypothetical protein